MDHSRSTVLEKGEKERRISVGENSAGALIKVGEIVSASFQIEQEKSSTKSSPLSTQVEETKATLNSNC